tara:strand:+ start:6760 stop:7479 length:720 start_codon:yes stop_codon:yes gene_type:complete
MKFILNFVLSVIDYSHKKKILKFLKHSLPTRPISVIDIGAHHGETLKLFIRNFDIKQLICYEASEDNFLKLKNLVNNLKKKINIQIFNKAIGDTKRVVTFNQTSESSSSTFSKINFNSKYFKRKYYILKFFFNKKYISKSYNLELNTLKDEINLHKLENIDLLKIDTEGFEFEILKGLQDSTGMIKFIYFEHHFDQMIIKNYTFRDINQLLIKAGFKKVFKIKMPLRKTFEYIYANKRN